MPRLVERVRALDMILFSKTVDANQALEMGLVDKIEGTKRFLGCFAETVMGHLIFGARAHFPRAPGHFGRLRLEVLQHKVSVLGPREILSRPCSRNCKKARVKFRFVLVLC